MCNRTSHDVVCSLNPSVKIEKNKTRLLGKVNNYKHGTIKNV